MRKYGSILLITGLLTVSFGLGYMLGNTEKAGSKSEKKPVLGTEHKNDIITEDTGVVFEEEYRKCGHLIISEFANRQDLNGKNIDEIRQLYTAENGYSICLEGNNLTIRQVIDDWCPEHKEKCRLKEYRGRVAIFKGPNSQHDVLIKVTAIQIEALPPEVVQAIRDGKYEFDNEQLLNDAMESLDDYS